MIRVLLVDDQDLLRRGLSRLLELEPDIEVVGEAASGAAALDVLATVVADVALVDARMPGMSGVELITHLAARFPHVNALLLTTFDEDEFVFGSLRAGARGFLLKDASPETLVAAIRTAARGGTVIDGQVSARVMARLDAGPPEPGPSAPSALSAREEEVARLVATGASNQEIARTLFLTEGTVKNHVSAALRKLGLRDRTQLALAFARRP
ncbi:response regulator [Catenuloplanes japonicus]|uniref:response regulator n=1 Tax=Catenuloplanes japonicus TaxID=33876 RepID=UPI0005274413|nr:response regulator transcription factor [Catenuloplanes japonicus]